MTSKPWDEWEDWLAGMYASQYTSEHVNDSRALLADPEQFRCTATEMLREWPNAAVHNLIYMWTGRNAWIGQASCTYAHSAPAAATREAWGTLTLEQQNAANRIAVMCRDDWEVDRRGRQTIPGI